jgi:hypothetical protein
MKRERCPTCRAVLPEPKTCANEKCGATFYRSEGGRADARFCSKRCATAQHVREFRRRQKEAS